MTVAPKLSVIPCEAIAKVHSFGFPFFKVPIAERVCVAVFTFASTTVVEVVLAAMMAVIRLAVPTKTLSVVAVVHVVHPVRRAMLVIVNKSMAV